MTDIAAPADYAELGEDVPRKIKLVRKFSDRVFRALAVGAGLLTLVILFLIGLFLLIRALPSLDRAGFSFLTDFEWNPDERGGKYGIGAIMYWTVIIAAIALVLAVPIAVITALFITEYAPRRLRRFLTALVDLLAAVPSLVYGLWGLAWLQPRMLGTSSWLSNHLGFIPILQHDRPNFASSSFIAGVVVSLMVLPITTSVVREVFSQTPPVEKEGALALGGTKWGMIRTVVLPFGRGGIVGGSMLGLGRALGETIAVALIISPIFIIRPNILESGSNSVASLIANRFGESQPNGISALIAAGLALFALTLLVNTLASVVVARSRSGAGVEA